jgi:ectoine hydroxylase-related dioxygenase (phytanoyl-CoA dioxygenase family)
MEGDLPGRKSWHQDLTGSNAHGDNLVTVWMSFDPVRDDEGVNLVRGSQRGPVYASLIGGFEGEPIPNVGAHPQDFEIVSFATDPGDLVLFHMAMLHGTGPTRPGQQRRTLALRFMGPDSHPGSPRRGKSKSGSGDDFTQAVYGTDRPKPVRRERIRVL